MNWYELAFWRIVVIHFIRQAPPSPSVSFRASTRNPETPFPKPSPSLPPPSLSVSFLQPRSRPLGWWFGFQAVKQCTQRQARNPVDMPSLQDSNPLMKNLSFYLKCHPYRIHPRVPSGRHIRQDPAKWALPPQYWIPQLSRVTINVKVSGQAAAWNDTLRGPRTKAPRPGIQKTPYRQPSQPPATQPQRVIPKAHPRGRPLGWGFGIQAVKHLHTKRHGVVSALVANPTPVSIQKA